MDCLVKTPPFNVHITDRAEPWRPIDQRHFYRKIDAETIVRQQQPHLDEPGSAHRLRCAYKKLFKEDKKFFLQQ